MDKNTDVKITIKMTEIITQLGIYLIAINKLLIEKGIYTEKEFCDFCDKAEKEDEEMKLIKQAIALMKCLS